MQEHSNYTILEARDADGKLHDCYYDEVDWYVERDINRKKEEGWTDFLIVQNPKNYKLTIEQ